MLSRIAGFSAVIALLMPWCVSATAEDDISVQVTTDSPAYCAELTNRCEALLRLAGSPPPDEAAMLTEEGRRLCAMGHNRAGVVRLRKALSLLAYLDPKQ